MGSQGVVGEGSRNIIIPYNVQEYEMKTRWNVVTFHK